MPNYAADVELCFDYAFSINYAFSGCGIRRTTQSMTLQRRELAPRPLKHVVHVLVPRQARQSGLELLTETREVLVELPELLPL